MTRIKFLAQPDVRLGDVITDTITKHGVAAEAVIVSAFVSLSTLLRFKNVLCEIAAAGGNARLVLGVDLGGTSKQVLEEAAGWGLPVHIIKNTQPGVTFHPKIYLFRWSKSALLIVGSNNLTDGGLYRNYEAAAAVSYKLPDDQSAYDQAYTELRRFLEPNGATARALTQDYLETLKSLTEIPSEAEARVRRDEATARNRSSKRPSGVFGYEAIAASPRLPPELQSIVIAARGQQHAEYKHQVALVKKARVKQQAKTSKIPVLPVQEPTLEEPLAYLDPSGFYITLPTMRADNASIPGEMRIPLAALEVAPEFWGWPDLYDRREESPRAGAAASEPRIYLDRHCVWRTSSVTQAGKIIDAKVRMYSYENSSDFRLMIGALNQLKGGKGDIIRVVSGSDGTFDYECTLATKGSSEFKSWSEYLVNPIRSSDRRYGYV